MKEDEKLEDIKVTEEDYGYIDDITEDEILEEVINDDENVDKQQTPVKKKIPSFHDNDVLPVKDKLTCFIDGYLVTLDEVDIKILNKTVNPEREEYLKNIKAESNQKLIYKVTNRLLRFEPNTIVKIDPEELYAAGWHALAKAINTYDYSKGWLFTTYAYKIIMNEMIQEIKRVKKKIVTKINGEKYETLAIHVSMESPIRNEGKGNDIYIADMIADSKDGPEKNVEKEDVKIIIMKALDSLDPTEKFVMTYRYGLDRDIILTQKEIAEKLNQSQANISKIEKTCRLKLRLLLKGTLGIDGNWED